MGVDSEHCVEFRLGASFKTYVIFIAVTDNFLYHRAHLVHLDRVYDEVFAGVFILFGSFVETIGYFPDSVVKYVGKSQEQRGVDIAQLQSVHYLFEVDRGTALLGSHLCVTLFVDREIFKTPARNVVYFRGVFDAPFSHSVSIVLRSCILSMNPAIEFSCHEKGEPVFIIKQTKREVRSCDREVRIARR